jgi:hypothetical protein
MPNGPEVPATDRNDLAELEDDRDILGSGRQGSQERKAAGNSAGTFPPLAFRSANVRVHLSGSVGPIVSCTI